MFVSIWISWPSRVESGDPQHKELGPLGGDLEFPSGTIKEEPPGSGEFKIEPATVLDKQFGQIYYNQADCPVSKELIVDVLVWDDDSSKNLDDIQKIINAAVAAATAAGAKGAALGGAVLNALIAELTKSADDALGRFTSKIGIPDPCQESFEVIRAVPLTNLAKDLWKSVNAEDKNGIPFKDRGIEPPDAIGFLELKVLGGLKINKFSSAEEKPIDPLAFKELIAVDLGQADESVITGVLSLGASLPDNPPPIIYSFFLDIDNDLDTGAQGFPVDGAEFELQLAFENSDSPVAKLFGFNPITHTSEEIPEGIYDAAINIDRAIIFLSIELETLGNPVGPIAGWGVVETETGLTDVLPDNPAMRAPLIPINTDFTGIPPLVVSTDPPHDAVDIVRSADICVTFSKSMDRQETENAFTIMPPVAGSFSWQGNKLCFHPSSLLVPFTKYAVVIEETAMDRVGTPLDGDGDLVPGDSFRWQFITEALPLSSTDGAGVEKDGFVRGDPIFVAGSDFPPWTEVTIYVIQHGRVDLIPGVELIDVTDDGATPVQVDEQGRLLPVFVGRINFEGEFNIVVDLDQEGHFDPNVDRVDRTGIGLFVLPSPLLCDVDADGDIDRNDINAIFARRNTPAVPGDPLDADGDGLITVADARICSLQCTNPKCAP